MSDRRIKIDLGAFGAYDLCESSAAKLRDDIDRQLKTAQPPDPQTMTEEECEVELRGKCTTEHGFILYYHGHDAKLSGRPYWAVRRVNSKALAMGLFVPISAWQKDTLSALREAVTFMRDKKDWSEV